LIENDTGSVLSRLACAELVGNPGSFAPVSPIERFNYFQWRIKQIVLPALYS